MRVGKYSPLATVFPVFSTIQVEPMAKTTAEPFDAKLYSVGHRFTSIFDKSRESNGQAFSVTFAPMLYKRCKHCSRARPARVAESAPHVPGHGH